MSSGGAQDNKKKISWAAWEKLCKDKELGGLGFKDREKFNQALLAKQAWRIWSNPDSLVARILKHIYFARSEILECSIGSRPSFAWRSIMHGRDLLSKGLVTKVSSGNSIKVWTDNWIVKECDCSTMYRQDAVVDLTLMVNEPIDPITRTWDVQRLGELFCDEDIEVILRTRFDLSGHDTKVWGFTKNGCYNSKSGYKLAETIHESQQPHSVGLPPIERRLWKDLWKSKTSPKIKHFMWRALSGALAVKTRLQTRGIMLDATCSRCGSCAESICHVLFHCEVAKKVWERARIPLPSGGFSVSSVWLNFYHLFTVRKKLPQENEVRLSFPWILWQLWKARNSFCFEHRRMDDREIFSKASDEAAAWLSLQLTSADGPSTAGSRKWEKQPEGFTKCNVASSWVNQSQNGGAAWIARDHLGIRLIHSRRASSPTNSALETGLSSLLWASEALHDLRFKKVILEISSPTVWRAINEPRSFPEMAL